MTSNQADELILNVDDTDAARYAKTRILTRAGFRVAEAASGADALALARSEMPSLVLLDVKLPDINGFDVCRMLKEDKATQMILVLQTSASFIGTSDKIRALEGGADNYLFEPIEPEELVANVRALLRLGRVERELRDMDRRKNEFLAVLAHELRNPLGPIRNAVEFLHHADAQGAQNQEIARQTILRQTDHMVRLIDDLLDVARISQGKITLRQEVVELKSVIQAGVESARSAIDRHQHRFAVELPDRDLWLNGDSVRLAQIICNLLTNAAKFTPPGGELAIGAAQQGDEVVIQVRDNGIGLSSEDAASIFELFTQAGHLPDRVQDGLGIGLALVKMLVELHHGSVSVASAGTDKGSTFEIRLPLAMRQAEPDHVDEASMPGAAGHRILVVDDNVDAADTLAALLEIDGHDVRKSYGGGAGIDMARQFRPDIIFLDIGLPDMTGMEVAARLRQLPETADAVIIALTGYGQERDKEQAIESGFDRHLTKPISFEMLTATIRSSIESRK
ncbi:His Kinase A (phospho-acceptor) domain-containing protein [Noviherbaspirillum humi]|uniref:histidine kinase n=1 Tax=Noviherbaspirillum humi TaxID=1688639 RepID=A0A239I461_9BURK|nr:response regulator [Noviherbaspirillum humi]SNS88271.1 His Kinase A (phospho-acceptor) domain-containing protein [Noviherbaspirillum humi]